MDDIIKEFVQESTENLDRLDREFVLLEKDPKNKDLLASVFRTIHTIKGTAGFLGFPRLEGTTHAGENLLSRMRDGELLFIPEIASGLLALVDAVRQMLGNVVAEGNDGTADHSVLIAKLNLLSKGQDEAATAQALSELQEKPSAGGSAPSRAEVSDSTVRLDVGLLDQLINQMGELVLARNQILQLASTQRDPVFVNACQRLNLITTELREGVMKARMQPISHVFGKFPRVVRDLSLACGKQVELEIEGGETELDRTLLDAIRDPLTHIVRNSVDHGFETPADRAAAGKPAAGKLFLRAYHEGGQVNVEITDDGGGIDTERVKSKALQKGLITAEQAGRMSDREVLGLVFLPGFSTAEKVTNVSGRGVGMDVVKTNIEKIGGAVDLQSAAGRGTTVRMKIPLTLAIIPALIVTSSGDRFAIPQASLLELVRVEGEQAKQAIEQIHDAPVYRLRGTLLPLVFLDRELRGAGVKTSPGEACRNDVLTIVVLQAERQQFGLVVDSVREAEEIVVKPLGQHLKGITVFAGATIMGDGEVALILDVLGLAQKAHALDGSQQSGSSKVAGANADAKSGDSSLLLFRVGSDRRMAVPLSLISRLEQFSPQSVERSGHREVIQYRDAIMPLIRVGDMLQSPGGEEGNGSLRVLVCSVSERNVGLVVEQILDIVDQKIEVATEAGGQSTSAVISGQVTDLLDVESVVQSSGVLAV
jgi:two-component system chemotaxis sensor kinase CheA